MRAFCVTLLLPGVASSAQFFVAPSGLDTAAGDAVNPLRTISHGLEQLQPGDTLVVNRGSYAESLIITRAGTVSRPIVLRGLPGATLVNPEPGISHSAIDVRGEAAYLVVEGFELTGGFGEAVFVRPGAHDVELAGLDVHHNQTGIWIAGAARIIVRDAWIHDNVRTGVRLFAGAHDVEILDTRAERHDDGMGCSGDADGFSADETTRGVRLVRVAASANSEDGFDLKASGVELHEAIAQANGCSGIKLGAGGALQNVMIVGSRIGANLNGTTGTTTALQSCTIIDNGIGVRVLGEGHVIGIHNCIVAGAGKALTFAAGVQLTEDYNIFHRPAPTDRLIVRMAVGGDQLYSGNDVNSGGWHADSGQGSMTVALDPLLDPDTYAPQAASAAIDSGDPGTSPSHDLTGLARPVGAAVDRGAAEWMPVAPTAVIRRALVRSGWNGVGEVRLEVSVTLPPGAAFDPSTDTVSVLLRGQRGEIARLVVDPAAWTRRDARTTDGSAQRARYRQRQRPRCRLSLDARAGEIGIQLREDAASVWALSDAQLAVQIELGQHRASTSAPLRGAGRRYSLP